MPNCKQTNEKPFMISSRQRAASELSKLTNIALGAYCVIWLQIQLLPLIMKTYNIHVCLVAIIPST